MDVSIGWRRADARRWVISIGLALLADESTIGIVTIDEALVRSLLAEQFPHLAMLPVRAILPGGWDNRCFRVGDALVARLPSHRVYAAQVAVEQAWLPVLAPALPLPIPEPVGAGAPGCGYPSGWSLYRWLPGDTADASGIDEAALATALAAFLRALHRCETAGAPQAGTRTFGRGGPLDGFDTETRQAVATLGDAIDGAAALRWWEAALAAAFTGPAMWFHGDLWLTNLLVEGGRLSAVIDWGLMGVGDPACDLAVAWRGFGPVGRAAFRDTLPFDEGTWARARGWALWKLAITATGMSGRAAERPGALAALRGLLAE